jgi:hypothetical protein
MLTVTSNWSMLRRNTNYIEGISELGTTLAVTSNWSTLGRNTNVLQLLASAMLFLVRWLYFSLCWRRYVLPKRRFLRQPQGFTFQSNRRGTLKYSRVHYGLVNLELHSLPGFENLTTKIMNNVPLHGNMGSVWRYGAPSKALRLHVDMLLHYATLRDGYYNIYRFATMVH